DNDVVKWLNPLCHYNGECFEMNHPEKWVFQAILPIIPDST
ncbi:MAG: hypothetical protein ACI8ZB_005160, partial [Desulforhopalus sp.]